MHPAVPENLEDVVTEYKRLWPLLIRLHQNIGKLISKDATHACAKRLRMNAKRGGRKVIAFAHDLEVDIFQDYLLYMYRPHGVSFVRQMLNRKRYPQESDEQGLLEAMAQARFSIFWIRELVSPCGFIALDVVRSEEVFILDLSIPQQEAVGILSGFRIFPYKNVWMHTGANLVIGQGEHPPQVSYEGRILVEKEERTLNEETIFRWRALMEEQG